MSRNRYDRTDKNEVEIVNALKKLGFSVDTNHNDILVGANGVNYWFEIKQAKHVSKKTGLINASAKRDGQKILEKEWKGHYKIVSSLDEILNQIGE